MENTSEFYFKNIIPLIKALIVRAPECKAYFSKPNLYKINFGPDFLKFISEIDYERFFSCFLSYKNSTQV